MFEGFHLLLAEMTVHYQLNLFQYTRLSGLHLSEKIGDDDDGCAGGIVK